MLDSEAQGGGRAPEVTAVPLVDVIESFDAFESLRPAWQALSGRDPEATIFLSWDWLAAAFRGNPRRWRVYVARNPAHPAQIVGLFPARLRVHWSHERDEFTTEIEAGGRLIYSAYTGFLCDPEWERAALSAIAARVAGDPWSALSLRYEASRGRAALFAAAFEETAFRVRWKGYVSNGGQTDNLLCPRVVLPDSYETYLQTLPKSETRQKIRRFHRRYLANGVWELTRADGATVQRDLDTLLSSWSGAQAEAKGRAEAERGADNLRRTLSLAQDLGSLHLAVIWRDGAPIGAVAHVLDHDMDRMHFTVAGYGPGAEAPSVGLLLHSESMRWAIENGFDTYDFGHGNEAYKYDFGARDMQLWYLSLSRRMVPKTFSLDRLTLPDALARVSGMVAQGKVERAQQALEQLGKLV